MAQRLEDGRIAAIAGVGELVVVAWREDCTGRVTLIANKSSAAVTTVDALGQVVKIEDPDYGEMRWLAAGVVDTKLGAVRIRLRGRETGLTLDVVADDGVWLLMLTPQILDEPAELTVEELSGQVSQGPITLGRLSEWAGEEDWTGYASSADGGGRD